MMSKVLLVEDDNNLREIFAMRLEAEGYKTLSASDGEQALVVATKEKPELIIADIMMPKLSGFEMLETLRSVPEMSNTKVIVMTALSQAEDQARGEKLGVVKYLVKSQVTLEDFIRVVREVLPPAESANEAGKASINKQESESKMPDDPSSTNPMPGDSPSPPTNPVAGDEPASSGSDGQMSTDEEKDMVNKQANDFAGGASSDSGMPADTAPASPPMGDMPAPEPPMPPSEGPQPPVEEPKPEEGPSSAPPMPGGN